MVRYLLFDNAINQSMRRQTFSWDPFDCYNDFELYERFRFTRQGIQLITDLIQVDLIRPTKRNCSLTQVQQVCMCLQVHITFTRH